VFALGLYRAFHGRHELQKAGRSSGALAALSVYGPVILVVAIFAGYLLAGPAMRVVLVIMLLIGAVGPSVASFAEGYAGEKKARNMRRWLFIILAALAVLVVFSFLVRLLLLLLVVAAVVAIVVLSGLLLGVFRR
jgi:predicted membrane channel-forming protein YqfA (hemolysin III family)